MRKVAVACGAVGVILLVAAGLLAFWITPQFIARVPGDYNKVRIYDGRIQSLFNPAALAAGNLAAAIKTGVPETLRRQVQVLRTSGNTALVKDSTMITSGGQPVGSIASQYAVNRQTLAATSSYPAGWGVTAAKGLTVSWPFGAKKQSYTGWVPLTQTTTTLKYVKQAQRGGVTTYVYRASVPPTPIKNAQVLSTLPKSLPVSLLSRISAAGLISSSQLATLTKLFPNATNIPLGYTYQATSTYWVAPATGIVVDISTSQRQMGGIALPTGKIVPLIPVLADTYTASPASLQQAATDASNGESAIQTFGTIIPIVALVVGLVLVALAIFFWLRGGGRGEVVAEAAGPPAPGYPHDQAA